MTSIIKADNISTVSGSGNITIPTGVKVIGTDTASIVAPGQVIQIVRGIGTSGGTSSSTTFVSEGIEATITPKFNNSIILVQVMTGDSNSGGYSYYRIRNTTDSVNIANVPCGNFSSSPQWLVGVSMLGTYIVNSTAARTFRVEGSSNTASTRYQKYSASVDDGTTSGAGIIILTEIAQ